MLAVGMAELVGSGFFLVLSVIGLVIIFRDVAIEFGKIFKKK